MHGKAIWFDLDGTLLPMDLKVLTDAYFKALAKFLSQEGFEPEELIRKVWQATFAMMKNDGASTNETVFWNALNALYPGRAPLDPAPFERFYRENYDEMSRFCGYQPEASAAVSRLKREGFFLVLATNPVFPRTAIETRLKWAGLTPELFDRTTTYENSRFCKPNPGYYRAILDDCGCAPEDCLLIGNDTEEDLPAREIGVRVFLVTDSLVNRGGISLDSFDHGPFSGVLPWIESCFPDK